MPILTKLIKAKAITSKIHPNLLIIPRRRRRRRRMQRLNNEKQLKKERRRCFHLPIQWWERPSLLRIDQELLFLVTKEKKMRNSAERERGGGHGDMAFSEEEEKCQKSCGQGGMEWNGMALQNQTKKLYCISLSLQKKLK